MNKIAAGAVFFKIQIVLPAQTASTRPTFDVVSIKTNETPERHRGMFRTSQGLRCIDYTLKDLIRLGWDVRDFQIRGGPKCWIAIDTTLKPIRSIRARRMWTDRSVFG